MGAFLGPDTEFSLRKPPEIAKVLDNLWEVLTSWVDQKSRCTRSAPGSRYAFDGPAT